MKRILQLAWRYGIIFSVLNMHIRLLRRLQKRTNRLIALDRCIVHSFVPALSDNPDDDERDKVRFYSKLADRVIRPYRRYYRAF